MREIYLKELCQNKIPWNKIMIRKIPWNKIMREKILLEHLVMSLNNLLSRKQARSPQFFFYLTPNLIFFLNYNSLQNFKTHAQLVWKEVCGGERKKNNYKNANSGCFGHIPPSPSSANVRNLELFYGFPICKYNHWRNWDSFSLVFIGHY